jgi:hypothetical protein
VLLGLGIPVFYYHRRRHRRIEGGEKKASGLGP